MTWVVVMSLIKLFRYVQLAIAKVDLLLPISGVQTKQFNSFI